MADITKENYHALKRSVIENDFSGLNEEQRRACFTAKGPLLILAGAGSGKTTVLVNRIAYLIRYGDAYECDRVPEWLNDDDVTLLQNAAAGNFSSDACDLVAHSRVKPWEILAITFTNKAAGELKERISVKLGEDLGADVWASTFHSTCAKILRRYADRLGYSSHFTIYDTDDSRRVMKEVQKELDIDDKRLPHKMILGEISRAKDSLITPADFAASAGYDVRIKNIAAAYARYQKKLFEADAMDFDDLISQTVRLFSENPDVLDYYRERFKYILVDEYQDTNHAQYVLVSMLAEKYRNICVVGDDNQSIYRFRGATIENILSFEEQYGDARVVRLEQNYRSTQNILDAANAVIKNNTERKEKNLWTANGQGEKITLFTSDDERGEAAFVAETILDNVSAGRRFSQHAVLYRMNAQSNAVENVFMRSGIPYRIFGGQKFYDRKEIKDMLAYMSVVNNPSDTLRLMRIINEPKRGIGDTTLSRIQRYASETAVSAFEIIRNADDFSELQRSAKQLKTFADMITELNEFADSALPHEVFERIVEKSGYVRALDAEGEQGKTRAENVKELLTNIVQYENDTENPSLTEFLENVALITDIDNYNADADTVVMMTLHSAKGLEFPCVFLVGMEEGVFPGEMAIQEGTAQIEEERRLAYVGITRAKERLYMTKAKQRMLFGFTSYRRPSRFVAEIPRNLVDEQGIVQRSFADAFGGSNYSPSSGGYSRGYQSSGYSSQRTAVPPKSTPAASYMPRSKPSAAVPAVSVGYRVKHRTFGAGMVVGITPMGNDLLVEVAFDSIGTKKLMANHARLEKE